MFPFQDKDGKPLLPKPEEKPKVGKKVFHRLAVISALLQINGGVFNLGSRILKMLLFLAQHQYFRHTICYAVLQYSIQCYNALSNWIDKNMKFKKC